MIKIVCIMNIDHCSFVLFVLRGSGYLSIMDFIQSDDWYREPKQTGGNHEGWHSILLYIIMINKYIIFI